MRIIIQNLTNQNKKLKKQNENYRTFISILILIFNLTFLLIDIDRTKLMTRTESLIRGKKYIKKCFDGKYSNSKGTIILNPKISVIIPIYNSQNTIKPSIRSIQNQNMKDIEIILVNDNSNDNTSLIINELVKEDKGIKILNNRKNMGTLYSRNIGVLNSKAKYVMNLDNDDLFFDDNVFDTIYKEGELNNFEII